jgi:GH24 family phage-related lysozyme (muramidase)
MVIIPNLISDFESTARRFTTQREGFDQRIYVDPLVTVPTVGYGYTLLVRTRGVWTQRQSLLADYAAINITLSGAQLLELRNIALMMNQGQDQAARLAIATLSKSIRAITEPEAAALYSRVLSQELAALETRFRSVLGDQRGSIIWSTFQNSLELIALVDIASTVGRASCTMQ